MGFSSFPPLRNVLRITFRLLNSISVYCLLHDMELGTCLDLRVLLQLDDQILLKVFLLWLMALRNPKFRAISLRYWIVFPRCIMSYSS